METWDENPFYWTRRGRPVLLLGGSDEDNLFNHPHLGGNLDILKVCGGNYVRCTMSSRDEGNVEPYAKTGDQYDLNRFNPEYWSRFEKFLKLARERDVIVQIELWATYDYYQRNWARNPFNPALNVNYGTETTRLVPEWDFSQQRKWGINPFFYSPPALNHDRVLLRYQQAFVKRILDISQEYDNVLYCVDNETRAMPDWAWFWAEFVLDEGRRRGRRFQVTEMWDDWDLRDSENLATCVRPDLFSFVEVSQNNWQADQTHYDQLLWMRERLLGSQAGARPMNNVKVYGAPRPGLDAEAGLNIDRFWKNIFAGCASARFHRPSGTYMGGIGLNETAQGAIGAARTFTDAFDIFGSSPRPDLLREREEDEAYCLANPGRVYALYFPSGGEIVLDAEGGPYTQRWFDPETASFHRSEPVGSGSIRLATPDTSQIWLALLRPERESLVREERQRDRGTI